MKKGLLIIAAVIMVALLIGGTIWLLRPHSKLTIVTSPTVADVWLDGAYAGITPFEIELTGRETHKLEIRADGYLPVIYEPTSNSRSGTVQIQLRPEGFNGSMSPDWNWGQLISDGKLSAVNLVDQSQVIPFVRYEADNQQTQEGEYGYSLTFAPDGQTVAYQAMRFPPNIRYGCEFPEHRSSVWLSSLEHPDQRRPVFVDAENPDFCVRVMIFSPDSKWLSADIEELSSTGSFPIYSGWIAPVQNPDLPPLVIPTGRGEVWSLDSQWLAFSSDTNNDLIIYHLLNDKWELYQLALPLTGTPLGWTEEGYLWVMSGIPNDQNNKAVFTFIDVSTGRVIQTIDSALYGVFPFHFHQSEDGRHYAFSYDGYSAPGGQQEPRRLLIGRNGTKKYKILVIENYLGIFYWLPDNQRIATWIKQTDTDGHSTNWMKIVDFPRSLR